MRLEDKLHLSQLSDEDLLEVTGGSTIQNERGEEVKEGRFITSKFGNYVSGELPRYSMGDLVKIKWRVSSHMEVLCNAQVMGVSESADAGLLFRKYSYCVKILSCPNSDMIGMLESNVHENCLYL